MSDENCKCTPKRVRTALYASVAANIFLAAFTLGHILTPCPPPGADKGHMMSPPGMQGEMSGDKAGPRRGPPPFFGPQALFTPEEMRAHEEQMKQDFAKVGELRKAFAARLATGSVTKEETLAHFAAIDEIMESVRKEAQDKAADKISKLSDEERQKFAKGLLQRDEKQMPPPGSGMMAPVDGPQGGPQGPGPQGAGGPQGLAPGDVPPPPPAPEPQKAQ